MTKRKKEPGLLALIRTAIKNSGRSLNQLAKDSGVDAGSLSRFNRGKRDLQGSKLEKLCRALGVRVLLPDSPPAEQKS